ncbi:hypothetical protein V9T40_002735 [Parthenolecanium corni]|uniref:Uncharacterized protein n=1 Tax=Parthenolecanium corni TaxID=536013 RepID=A0AAN9Y4R4_9HEMI
MILIALVLTVELKVIEIIRSNADREEPPATDETEKPTQSSALKNSLRNEMFDNYAGKFSEVNDRIEDILDPVIQDRTNSSNILLTFVKHVRRQVNPEPISSSQKPSDSDEIMETAEMYLRPLSRYRELQEKKKNNTHGVNNVISDTQKRNLGSKSPQYCLPANGGLICFYKM